MMLVVDLQVASSGAIIPNQLQFTQWINAVLRQVDINSTDVLEVSVRIVDEEESQALNRDYRQQDKPTNVLSFPADIPDCVDLSLLGDLVICAPVVVRESNEQQKPAVAHWAHMTIHGVLHLLGYNHIEEADAHLMEALEERTLADLGFPSPYAVPSLERE